MPRIPVTKTITAAVLRDDAEVLNELAGALVEQDKDVAAALFGVSERVSFVGFALLAAAECIEDYLASIDARLHNIEENTLRVVR